MATYEIEIPRYGKFRVESPSELSDQQAYQAAFQQAQAEDMQRMADPVSGMSTGQRIAAGAGKAVSDLGLGAKQGLQDLAGKVGLSRFAGSTSNADIVDRRRRDAPLMGTTGGMAGNFLGNTATLLPTMMIPGVNTYAGAAAIGGALGATQPVAEGDSRLLNTALHAGGGVAGQGIGNLIGRVIKPVQSALPKGDAALARAAAENSIPITAGQATGSRPLQVAESVMENMPFTSGPQLALKEAQGRAFTKAALAKAGIVSDDAGAAVLAGQKSNLGGQFQSIAGRNSIDFNQGSVLDDLAGIASEGSRRLSNPSPLNNTIEDILRDANQGIMQGAKYQGWRETLGRLARGNGTEAHYFGQVKKALDKAFASQVPAAEAQAWQQASRQYANLKTITDAMGGAGAGTKTGMIQPAQLEGALTKSIGREGKALGRGDLNELVSVGRKFVSDNIPNSGTAQRQLMQSLLTGGGGAGVGAGAGAGVSMATGNDPWKGAAVGAGLTAGGLLAPRAVQAMMNSPAGQAYLMQGLLSMTPAQLAAINALSRSAGAGAIGYVGQQ